ncbi:MAG: dihydrofolate reductase family protein, partial [Actinobacteria bacterium]|nr:dihydrofolate reductase family protein [Actinomycetota bacterium]
DVRLGGGPSSVREFLAAGLVDLLHVVQVPLILGRGVSLWEGLEGLEEGYRVESTTTPSGVTHLVFIREG